MRTYGTTISRKRVALVASVGLSAAALLAASASGCGDDPATTGPSSSSSASSSGSGGSGGDGGGGDGGAPQACTAPRTTRGAALAISPDDRRIVAVNRDVGTVSVFDVDYADNQPAMKKIVEIDLGKGSEPWHTVIDSCGGRTYVVLRRDQKVVRIDDPKGEPKQGPSAAVGSEPTGLALTPNSTKLYVANLVDGTLSVVDPEKMAVVGTVDLNATLAATGYLGTAAPRPALAHPRALAITNNGDANDQDETVYATEWFAQRVEPESPEKADTNKKGLLYKVSVAGGMPTTIDLPPLADAGFHDHKDQVTGCFPNRSARSRSRARSRTSRARARRRRGRSASSQGRTRAARARSRRRRRTAGRSAGSATARR